MMLRSTKQGGKFVWKYLQGGGRSAQEGDCLPPAVLLRDGRCTVTVCEERAYCFRTQSGARKKKGALTAVTAEGGSTTIAAAAIHGGAAARSTEATAGAAAAATEVAKATATSAAATTAL